MMWYRNIYWSKITLLYRNEVKCHICCEYFSFVKDCTQYDCVFILFLIKFLWVSSDVYRTSNFLSLWSISSSLLCFHNTKLFCTRLPRKKLTTTKERKWLFSGILSRQPVWQEVPLTIFQLPIIHSVCPPNFAELIVLKCSWENAILPGAFKNNGLCRIWGANRVYYGQLENTEYNQKKNQQTTWCPFQRLNEWMNNFIYRGWHITVKNW